MALSDSGTSSDVSDVPRSSDSSDLRDIAQEIRDSLRVAIQMVRVLEYPGELSTAQVSVLNTLAEGPARIGDLARLSGVTQPGMSQLVSRLGAAGLVRRRTSAGDARVTLVDMTEAGREALAEANRQRNGVLSFYLDRLDATDREKVRAGLGPLSRLAAEIVRQERQGAGSDARRERRDAGMAEATPAADSEATTAADTEAGR
ncbi:MarR family winged helix-turn-helix transcriptional regulator [Corynebacterium neomassiliense]|uniref:MarR family winged helix-turn-helix transcriptional regulator n=1 Tax=Corynebacterium neomassiliense TaxID=2079482 RepID=UPI001031E710|nr:MarR family transcriptional regulator [Corynebacterium neomassiliense]